MTAHSLLGASGAHRWLNCPGSFNLSQTVPARPASIHAATGTLAHGYIEQAVDKRGRVTEIPVTEIGRQWSVDGHFGVVDQDLLDGVNVMLDYIKEASRGSDWLKVEFPVRLDRYLTAKLPPVPVFGTVDAGILARGTLEIIDYKNGAGVIVTPIENPQLMFYAAGALAEAEPVSPVDNIKLTIVQPNAGGIRSWETTPLDVLMWVDEVLIPGIEACTVPDAPLNPGNWCRFCPAAHACPKLHQDAVIMAKQEFNDVDVPDDPAELAKALDTAERAMTWITKVQEHALEQLQKQVKIPGWTLVPTRPSRKWIDDDATVADALRDRAVFDSDIFETRVRSPAQLEKAVRRYGGFQSLWDKISPLAELRSSGVKLARDRNSTSPQADFTDE